MQQQFFLIWNGSEIAPPIVPINSPLLQTFFAGMFTGGKLEIAAGTLGDVVVRIFRFMTSDPPRLVMPDGTIAPTGWIKGEALTFNIPGSFGQPADVGSTGGAPVYPGGSVFYEHVPVPRNKDGSPLFNDPTLVAQLTKSYPQWKDIICAAPVTPPDPKPLGSMGTTILYAAIESAPLPGVYEFLIDT